MKNKNFIFFIVLIVFLIFLKSDFRIINNLQCCNDDFDYYAHASTIAEDFDLYTCIDYSINYDLVRMNLKGSTFKNYKQSYIYI